MGIIFREFLELLMGKPGRFILDFVGRHKTVFIILFLTYATILVYSKIILHYYYPAKMKELLADHREITADQEILSLWQLKKQAFPWYILIPSRNELWVRMAAKSDHTHKLLFFNRHDPAASDLDVINQIKNKGE